MMAHLYQRDKSSAEGLQGIQKKAKKVKECAVFSKFFLKSLENQVNTVWNILETVQRVS